MVKKILALLMTLALLAFAAVPAMADLTEAASTGETLPELIAQQPSTPEIPAERQLDLFVDNAELLTPDEGEALNAKLTEISDRNMVDVAIVTVNSLDGVGVKLYADDFYDFNGYGYGENDDGILLLLAMETREWAITTYGSAINTFTPYRQDCIMNDSGVLDSFAVGDYGEGFGIFADECDAWLTATQDGYDADADGAVWPTGYFSDPDIDLGESEGLPFIPPVYILISVAAGFLVAFVALKIIAAPLKSVRKQTGAGDYVVPGTMAVTNANDVFLYSNVTRTAIPKDDGNSHSGGGGGGSVSVGSSGRSHGGSSGHF